MSRLPIRVVKVGGSLFDLADLAERLRGWLAEQTPAHHVLVAGGGALVEQVRQWHRLHPLSDEAAHWICVDLMTVTAHMLHDLLPEIPLVVEAQLPREQTVEQGCTIFAPAKWLRLSEPNSPGQTLPANWDVTSDAISGRLAVVIAADELMLLKSALPVGTADVQELASKGYVDSIFASLAAELPPTQLVDLRVVPHESRNLYFVSDIAQQRKNLRQF